MLLFALFTIGYLMGVLMTLSVFVPKKELEAIDEVKSIYLHDEMNEWEVHEQLVKPNYNPQKSSNDQAKSPVVSGVYYKI